MAGLFSRLKIWNPGESLSASDLNGEFNHFLSNIDAEHSEGYSANLSEMQTTENPGGLGSENLTQPISVAQEIERLRYVINRVIGKSYWYQAPAQSIEGLNSTVSGVFGVSPSRIVSAQKTTLSGFPTFLQANGASGVRLNASAGTPFNCFIDTNYFSYTANISSGVLSGQPANNTATLASSLGGGQASRNATEFVISSAGAGITSNIGRQAIFSIVNGGNTEYFLGTIASSTIITGIKRGYFYDTSNVAVGPITLTTGHTITLLRTTYVFLRNDGTLQVTYNPPSYMGTAPISPSINDYWFDMTVNSWKIFNGNWISANSVYIGMCAQGPVNTVCARSENFFANYSSINEIVLKEVSNSYVSTRDDVAASVSVYGSLIKNDFKDYLWDMASNMFPGESEAASTTYYFYLNNYGTSYISSIAPIKESSIYGWYHPYEALRCIGSSFNDASSNLTTIVNLLGINYVYALNPSYRIFTSGTAQTYYPTYAFYVYNATVAAGDTYTNNAVTFTVLTAATNSNIIYCSASSKPTSFGTLVRTAGTGDANIAFTQYVQPKYIKVRMVGGGGGGSGGGVLGIAGNNSSFGAATANGAGLNGAGGSGSLGGYLGFVVGGGSSGNAVQAGGGTPQIPGHPGGNSFYGGGGGAAVSAATNSGSGGGGANGGGGFNGGGGGAGGYCEFIISNPAASYTYTVGAVSTGTVSNGAAGRIDVEEYYS